jgi:hypothetical protein
LNICVALQEVEKYVPENRARKAHLKPQNSSGQHKRAFAETKRRRKTDTFH